MTFANPYRNRTTAAPAAPALRLVPKHGSAAGKRHMARVAQLSCACGCGGFPVELHHIRVGQGGAQRAADFLVIPLTAEHHRGPRGIHGDKSVFAIRKLTELDMLADTIRRLELT